MKPNPKVFIALKNGDLVKAITEIEPSQLKPFMPVLMLGAFQHTSTRSPALDEICSKLIDYQSGNQLLQLMKLDYAQIQYKCVQTNAEVKRLETKNFHQLNLDEKLLHVCLHIVSQVRKWNILTSLPNYSDSFDPFDVEYCHEEVTWLVTMASFFMPEIFELKQFVAALLPYVHGPKLISYFVANQPHTSDSVIQTIMAVKCPDEDGYLAKQRNEAIIYLLEMDDKSSMHRFINETLETSSHLYIIVSILCSEIVDEENFVRLMAPCLTRKDGKLVSFLSKTGNRTTLKRLIDRINGILDRNPTSKMNEELVILIALFCSLFTIRLTPEESLKWLLFLTNQTQPSEDLLKTTLCTILACPQLINYSPVSKEESSIAEHHLANYFQWIRELIKREPEKFDSLNQLILLITVHFNSNKNDELVALFSSVLGFQVPMVRKINSLKSLYINRLVSDQDLAEMGSNFNVTKRLSAKSVGPLPAHTITQILSARNFANQSAQIQEWLKQQLVECEAPIHPIMAKLLELYAQSCIPERENQSYLRPIEENFFKDLFASDIYDNTKLMARILSLYYILIYTYVLDTKPLPATFQHGLGLFRYSSELWAKIPIRYLLSLVDARPNDFLPLRSTLFKLTAFCMPHMLPTLVEALEYHHGNVESKKRSNESTTRLVVSEDQLESALNELPYKCDKFTRLIEYVDASPIQEQHRHMKTIAKAMSKTLDASIARSLIEKVCSIWHRLENIVPRHIYEATFSHLIGEKSQSFENELLVAQPLSLFRVDERVFSSPVHFQCLMNMLAFYLEANRAWNQARLNRVAIQNLGSQNADVERAERNDLHMALENAQNSAIVQMLLEICDGDPVEKPYLEEIRRIACAQIHEMFIANINLAKLVHFQTYPIRLIPIMIKGVPSTHMVISFITELLATPDIKRRIFAIALTAELIYQYKIVDSFNNLELIVNVLDTLLDTAPSELNVELFLNLVSTIERFVQVSPFTAESYIELLERVQTFAASRLAVFSSIFNARHSPEHRLLELVAQTLEQCRNVELINRS